MLIYLFKKLLALSHSECTDNVKTFFHIKKSSFILHTLFIVNVQVYSFDFAIK